VGIVEMDNIYMNIFIDKLFDIVTKYVNRYNNNEKILGESNTIKVLLSIINGHIHKLKNSYYNDQLDAYKSTFNLIYIECKNIQSYFKKQYDKNKTTKREEKLKFVTDLIKASILPAAISTILTYYLNAPNYYLLK